MESASALYDLAERQGRNQRETSNSGRIASFLEHALKGFAHGREAGLADRTRALTDAQTVLENQGKIQDMKIAAENQKIARNLAKRIGLLDLDPNEKDSLRGSALDELSVKTAPTDVTTAGRIASMMIGGSEYAAVPSWSQKGGMSIDYKPVKDKAAETQTATQQQDLKKKSYEMAAEAARRDKFNQIQSLVQDPNEAAAFANVQPTQDEIEKYLPESLSYLKGDAEGYKTSKKRRGLGDEAVTAALAELQEQIQGMRNRGSDFIPWNEDQEGLDAMIARRNKIITGGGLKEVRAGWSGEIKRLAAKAKSGKMKPAEKERLKQLTKRLIQLGEIGGQ